MAAYLNPFALGSIRTGLVCLMLMAIASTWAQGLPDPTRPPAAMNTGGEPVQAAPSAPVLQSILISQSRRQAIINGQTVKVGDSVGEAKVVKITDNEVVLRKGKGLQTLKVFPNIEKRSKSGRADSKTETRRQ